MAQAMDEARSQKPIDPLKVAIRACLPGTFAAVIISMFINATMLAMPIYSMQIYDRVLASRNETTLLLLTLIVLIFLVLYGILEYARSGVLVRSSVAFERVLRRPLFDAMMRAELDPERRQGQQLIRDAEAIRDSLASGTVAIICDLPWTPLFVLLCYFMHPVLGMIALVGAVVLFALAVLTEILTKRGVDQSSRLSNDASTFAASALRNGEVVRGLGMGDTVLERWSGQQSAAVAANVASAELTAALVAMSKFARIAVQTGVLAAGAWLAIEKQISPGAMMAASIIIGRALAPVEQIVGQWKRIVGCRSAYRRLRHLMNEFPQKAAPVSLPVPQGQIEVENVAIVPPAAAKPSVRGVSFSVQPGESVAIVGSSGSGKSSLARALAGVWELRAGEIRIDGAALNQWDRNKLGKSVGYLPQDVELFAGTVADNIARLADVDSRAVVAAAKAAGAHDVILRLPQGYDTPIGEGGLALSGGMRQRVGLARALYGDPRLIVLDEPNSNLDEEGERALGQAIAAMKEAGRTVVVVTHRPQLLAYVDKVLVMSFGTALAFGDRDDVIARMRGNKVAAVQSPRTSSAA
ncbi:type I secretion system permease/ATPase [Phreatobacter sp.]|jgi:ATP-binding cassette subfamily C protein/ATP-binding cassette subfamily C protein EexD|uniref:type I secretion system permease/ATPase n=1 Tax=Phreatobacter sp. TaxID=1966341 RepID=UPI0025F5917C|nr:type I secretion system permease/ATPase [Phreatobacter sp.]